MRRYVGSLGLVLNAVVLWATRYLDAAVAQLRACPPPEHEVKDEDVARLSALKHRNLNFLGRYNFRARLPVDESLRPLRDPSVGDGEQYDEQE